MSKRMQKPLTNTPAVITVGLDIGYGVTKAVTEDHTVAFPSVMGAGHHFSFKAEEATTRYPGMQLFDGGDHIFVGDLALSQLRPHQQRYLRGRTVQGGIAHDFRRRLMLTALGQLCPSAQRGEVINVRIATGLPVDHMGDSGDLKSVLLGQHLLQTDQVETVVNVFDVAVMPQPYGTIYDSWLTPSGAVNECYKWTRTGVIDIGTYTIDAAADDDGEFLPRESASIEGGLYTAQELISQLIEAENREKPGYRMIEQVLRTGRINLFGKEINLSSEAADALYPLQEAVLNLTASLWKSGMNLDVIWVAGGGAPYVFEALTKQFPHVQQVDQPHLANARGYLHYALSQQG